MKRAVAALLIVLFAAPPAGAAEARGVPLDWSATQTLKTGTEIVVAVSGAPPARERFLFADDAALFTRKATPPKLPRGAEKALEKVRANWPGVFDDGLVCRYARVRVSRDGVFDGDHKLAELSDVVRRSGRDDVQTVSPASRASATGRGLAAVAVWVLVGISTAILIGTIAARNQ